MAQSLIPFPSTSHPNDPISRRWIAFLVNVPGGAREVLESYVPWSTSGDLLQSDLIPFGLLMTSSNRSGSARSMAALDFRPIPLDWARQLTKLCILERTRQGTGTGPGRHDAGSTGNP